MSDSADNGWDEQIIAAFQTRLTSSGRGYEVVTVSLDHEYLRYFDRVLEELSINEARLPHPRNPDRTLLRSAAVEVVMETFIARRASDTQAEEGDIAAAMTGDLAAVLLDGLERRVHPQRRPLTAVGLLLRPEASHHLDNELRRLVTDHFDIEDRPFYLAEGLADLRAAFVEACLVTWMILHELVAEEAVPALGTSVLLQSQDRASRRRRRFRLA